MRAAPVVRRGDAGITSWRFAGPSNVGGRVRCIAVHPADRDTLWVGTAGGGIWKTTDAGTTWRAQDDFLPTLAVATILVDPAHPDSLLAGTGEGFFDTPDGSTNSAAIGGAGIFRSEDGGETWNILPGTAAFGAVNELSRSADGAVVLAATATGIRRSTDDGASWTAVTGDRTLDVLFSPAAPQAAVAGRADGVALWSTDGGVTWSAASGPSGTRVELAWAPSTPSTVYASVSRNDTLRSYLRIFRSTDGGKSYATTYAANAIATYSSYNDAIVVDPDNPDVVVVGGVYLYLSTDGGRSFSRLPLVHVDIHSLVTVKDAIGGTMLYVGQDGGVELHDRISAGSVPKSLANGLAITQFYSAALSTGGLLIGGAQDNSVLVGSEPGGFHDVTGGDGGFVASDPTDPLRFYAETQYLALSRSIDGGRTFRQMPKPPDPGPNFIPPFILDPNEPRRMLAGGAKLWVTDDVRTASPVWRAIRDEVDCDHGEHGRGEGDPGRNHFFDDPPCNVASIAVAPGHPDDVWIGQVNGEIWRSENATQPSPTFTRVDRGALPERWASRIAIDPQDRLHAVAGFLGYAPDGVFETRDGGASWRSLPGSGSARIPPLPVTSVAFHPLRPDWLYAGTDAGLFVSSDAGGSWYRVADGPGYAPVSELTFRDPETLVVATFGRGAYVATIDPAACEAGSRRCGEN